MTTGEATPLNILAAIANEHRSILQVGAVKMAAATAAPRPPFKKRPVHVVAPASTILLAPPAPVVEKAKTAPAAKAKPAPAQYLQQLFTEHKIDATRLPKRPVMGDFVKPDEKECESYNAAVRFVRSNDLEQLQALHKDGQNLDVCNRVGESLVMVACRRGHVAIADFLMNDAKVRWDVRDDFGRTVLHDACWRPSPSTELMEVLIKVVSPEWLLSPDVRGHTPFDYARREHAGVWYDFLKDHEDVLKRRLSLIV